MVLEWLLVFLHDIGLVLERYGWFLAVLGW